MVQGITTGVAGIAVLFVILKVSDTVFGQPRHSNGQFGQMRTTQFLDLLTLVGVVVIGVMVLGAL